MREPNASRIRLRPRHDVIHVSRGRTVLAVDHEGTIHPGNSREGLFVYQTRTLSKYCWTIDGKQPRLSAFSPVKQFSCLAYYYQAPPNCKDTPAGECNPLQETVELKISRVVGEGMHEDVEVTNHTQIRTSITLALEAAADFVARQEIQDKRKQHGGLQTKWGKSSKDEWQWSFDYQSEHRYEHQGDAGVAHLHRGITLHLRADSPPQHRRHKLSFQVDLQPHAVWKACLKWQPLADGRPLPVEPRCHALLGSDSEYSRKQEAFLRESTRFVTPDAADLSATVQRVTDRARLDLTSLRLFDLDEGEHNWKLAAGVPTYLAVFGRDMLAASWQASILSNDMARGALSELAKTQSHGTDDWRDAQPGRILHEKHTDPLSVLNFTPHGLYYGTANAPFLFAISLSELWHCTGDKNLVRPYIRPALETLAWADKYSRDYDGFYKYRKRSEQGLKNQGWKDSSDAIVYPDGSQVEDPLGTCEMQAFAYAAKLHLAETLWWMDDTEDATRLYDDARELKQRFNERFWIQDQNYIAMAVDKDGGLVTSIASDPGHCLLSGILETDLVPQVVNRLMQRDMFSGWGIRTLSSKHPAYNPFAYHRGTVWPVENGSFVLGMARYGLHAEMWRLSRALLEAATLFDYDRLPEVFGGHPRDEKHPFPCLYEEADSPQAWSSSVPLIVLQALLGLYPYAPLNALLVDPWLPDWLPEITIENLCVGKAHVSLRFRRNDDGRTDYTVLQNEQNLRILRQPSPWSLTATWGERVKDAISSLLSAA
ncbi:MAG TPA: glycogen debranching N-terminal domain-containing protein [Terriglobales bacterium]|nr:glycogen debranching N-terminal domain-containing protein [Terriglobales bacterium]